MSCIIIIFFFFFIDTATTEIYTLSLHDALPIYSRPVGDIADHAGDERDRDEGERAFAHDRVKLPQRDRKSTRLNSSHTVISYAVFCLKKKNKQSEINTSALAIIVQSTNIAEE